MSEDLERELEKIRAVLDDVETYLLRHGEMNAALHRNERVMYSPLCIGVVNAKQSLVHVNSMIKEELGLR